MAKEACLVKVTRNGRITLPVAARRAAGIQEGDTVTVAVEGETITLSPQRLIDKSQAYFWTEDWQKAELEASEDIVRGRTRAFDDVEALIQHLESGDS